MGSLSTEMILDRPRTHRILSLALQYRFCPKTASKCYQSSLQYDYIEKICVKAWYAMYSSDFDDEENWIIGINVWKWYVECYIYIPSEIETVHSGVANSRHIHVSDPVTDVSWIASRVVLSLTEWDSDRQCAYSVLYDTSEPTEPWVYLFILELMIMNSQLNVLYLVCRYESYDAITSWYDHTK